jgi:hypothetical protein
MTAKFNPGSRLRSQVCLAEVVVVRGGKGEVDLTCGGAPMMPLGSVSTMEVRPVPGLMTGAALGKRYIASGDETFEVLVTKPGDGTLADGTDPLLIKSTKPLPASD